MNIKAVPVLLAALACAVAVSACGSMRNTIEPTAARASALSIELAAPSLAAQAPILAARADGNLTRAGVDLTVRSPATPSSPLADVQDGQVDVAVVSEPELMLARSAGATVVGLGAITQSNSDSIIALRSRKLRSLGALRGRTVGLDGQPAQRDLLDVLLTRAHVPIGSVRTVDVGFDAASALTSRRVAAAFADDDAAIALRRSHHAIDVLSVVGRQVPAYDALVFVTRETFFANNVNLLRRFVQAVGRGAAAVRGDPASGVSALQSSDPSLGTGLAQATLTATLPAMFPSGGEPWGWQSQATWNTFGRWMTGEHLIDGEQAWYAASINQLLAGQGP